MRLTQEELSLAIKGIHCDMISTEYQEYKFALAKVLRMLLKEFERKHLACYPGIEESVREVLGK